MLAQAKTEALRRKRLAPEWSGLQALSLPTTGMQQTYTITTGVPTTLTAGAQSISYAANAVS